MKKALLIASVLFVAVVSTACINNIAVQELNNKAAEYMQKGDFESAMNRLQASIDLDSTIYETYYNLGIASIKANKYDKAIEAFEKGIELKPDFSNFYYSLAVAQSDYADKILDNNDEVESASITEDEKVVEKKKDLSKEDLKKVNSLKIKSKENFVKYLELEENSKDKENIESLVKDIDEYLEENNLKVEE